MELGAREETVPIVDRRLHVPALLGKVRRPSADEGGVERAAPFVSRQLERTAGADGGKAPVHDLDVLRRAAVSVAGGVGSIEVLAKPRHVLAGEISRREPHRELVTLAQVARIDAASYGHRP